MEQYVEELSGKVVVDITNPVDWETFDGLVTPPDSSAAEEISRSAPEGARVVKVFNTTFAGTLVEGEVAGQPLDVYLAGDDEEANEMGLAAGAGWRAGGDRRRSVASGAAARRAGLLGNDAPATAGFGLPERLEASQLEEPPKLTANTTGRSV